MAVRLQTIEGKIKEYQTIIGVGSCISGEVSGVEKSNCARPPHPKGMGYALGRAPRLARFQKHPNLRFTGSAR